MKLIYLIGGMGAGKSCVTDLFVKRGVPVCNLDKLGHQALKLEHVRRALKEAFGEDVYDANGLCKRRLLAARAFSSPERLATLNAITTPAIKELEAAWIFAHEASGNPFVVVEVSAYDGPGGRFTGEDYLLAVAADEELRVSRAVASGFAEEDVRNRIAAQPTEADRAAWADAVLDNGGTLDDLERAFDEWWEDNEIVDEARAMTEAEEAVALAGAPGGVR